MGTLTAQMLVGSPHPQFGGILPSHTLYLTKNDRPAWTLVSNALRLRRFQPAPLPAATP